MARTGRVGKLTNALMQALRIAETGGVVVTGANIRHGRVENVSAKTILTLIRRGLLKRPYGSGDSVKGLITPEGRDALAPTTTVAKKTAAPVEPRSLAEAARLAGYEPETEEGGRTMMQAITPEHIRRAEAVRKMATLKPGDEIEYTNFTIGGSFKGKAIVTWDHGKSVEARTLRGENLHLERAADGSLRRFT